MSNWQIHPASFQKLHMASDPSMLLLEHVSWLEAGDPGEDIKEDLAVGEGTWS